MPNVVKHILYLLFLLVPLSSAVAEGTDNFTLEELMQSLEVAGDTKASYTETRSSRLSKRLIKSSGVLEFIAPDILIRTIISPRAAVYEVRGNLAIVERGGKRRSRTLEQLGAARGFVESLRATLAGDLVGLEKYYALEVSGNRAAWQLILLPKLPELAKKIKQITIEGCFSEQLGGMRVAAIRVEETNGNFTKTQITATE